MNGLQDEKVPVGVLEAVFDGRGLIAHDELRVTPARADGIDAPRDVQELRRVAIDLGLLLRGEAQAPGDVLFPIVELVPSNWPDIAPCVETSTLLGLSSEYAPKSKSDDVACVEAESLANFRSGVGDSTGNAVPGAKPWYESQSAGLCGCGATCTNARAMGTGDALGVCNTAAPPSPWAAPTSYCPLMGTLRSRISRAIRRA